MKIGIDARLYGTKHGGIGRYTQELIRNLLTIDPDRSGYVFFVYNKEDERQIRADIPIEAAHRIRCVIAPYRCYTLTEQLFMPLIIKRAKVDLIHFPHFNVPLLYTHLCTHLRRGEYKGGGVPRFIVTIHDLIIHHFPDERATTLPRWLYHIKLMCYKRVMRHAVMNACAIITPTEFVKNDLLRFYKIQKEKIKVGYEGVSNLNSKLKTQNSKPQLKTKNLLPYLLYVGSFYPHKNVERLIDAFHILRTKYHFDVKLVMVGKKDYFQKQVEKYLTTHYQLLITHCFFHGHASDEDLNTLYQNAALFVFPSLYEGFGLPPLEAMSFGVPVVASRAACIPEILKNAAIYYNPGNIEEMADKIALTLKDIALQKKLQSTGFQQVQTYSWERMAKTTLQIYKNVV